MATEPTDSDKEGNERPIRVYVLGDAVDRPFMKRLQLLGFRVQQEEVGKIRSIDRGSTELVYLADFTLMDRPEWSEVRVRLARAGRYYVIFGKDLGTAEIMKAARDGAHDVVLADDKDERLADAIGKAADDQALWWQLYGSRGETGDQRLVGESSGMRSLREAVARLGPTEATVVIIGESGTGKERVAEALHRASGKPDFVSVNCAAIPRDLIESELFGVEKGAFTGAVRSKPGLVEEAAGGTLFLDEIGELDMPLQPKLLRFLETRRARRVGSTKEYHCNVRVISATNQDLEKGIDEGTFRADLYYRLAEVTLSLPPLRHRKEDIPDLATVFRKLSAERLGKNFENFEPELIRKFQEYRWPGNIRELKQVIERLTILYDGPKMRAAWWDPPARRDSADSPDPFPQHASGRQAEARRHREAANAAGAQPMPSRKQKMELAKKLLEESDNDLTWVAAQLGVHPTTLYRWRKSGKV